MKKLMAVCLLLLIAGAGMIYLGVMPRPFFGFVDTYIPAISPAVGELGAWRGGGSDAVAAPAGAPASLSEGESPEPGKYPLILDAVVEGVFAHEETIVIPVIFPEGDDGEVTEYFLRQVELAIDHIRRSRPDIFWVSLGSYNIEWNGSRTTREGSLTVHLSYCHTKAESDSLAAEMDAVIGGVVAGAPKDPARAAEYFHDWIINSTVYDSKLADAGASPQGFEYGFNIDGVFIRGSAVCEGYSKAFKLLCDRAGIPCESVFGVAGSENHSWNYVLLEGGWYLVDSTWDDPVGAEDTLVWDYCLRGSESEIDGLPVSAIYQPDYADYPSLAENDYHEFVVMKSLQAVENTESSAA
ncbi:MAG: hypothetical protein LBU86_04325 [Oscillospiraceae bacterium]|nr:hypothetical protein [Oscillospiraceae bacterium]